MTLRRLRLVQRRRTLGHTQEELAALLGVDRSTVLRWEHGDIEPQPWQRPKLAHALRVTAEELSELLAAVSNVPSRRDGYALVSSVPLDFSLTTGHAVDVVEGFTAYDLASRRQVLEQLAVLTSADLLQPIRQWLVSLPVVAVTDKGVGADELDELDEAVRLFRRWDASGVGGLKRKAVVGQLTAVGESLSGSRQRNIGRRLLQITGELAQLAGWMSYDQGLPGVAQRYYLLALHACRESGNAALGAKVIGDMTQLSTSMGHYHDSLDLARSGLYALPRARHELVRSELLGLEARAHSQIGSSAAADAARSAEACVEVWHDAPADPVPDWLHYMNQAEVDCLAANAYIQLALHASDHTRRQRHGQRAEHYTLHAKAARTNGYNRSSILDELRLARVRLAQAEPVESAAVAVSALAMADRARSSVVCEWLIRHHEELTARYPVVAEPAQFTVQLRDYLRRAAPLREAEVSATA